MDIKRPSQESFNAKSIEAGKPYMVCLLDNPLTEGLPIARVTHQEGNDYTDDMISTQLHQGSLVIPSIVGEVYIDGAPVQGAIFRQQNKPTFWFIAEENFKWLNEISENDV